MLYTELVLPTAEPTATERERPSSSTNEENLATEPTTEEGEGERKTGMFIENIKKPPPSLTLNFYT